MRERPTAIASGGSKHRPDGHTIVCDNEIEYETKQTTCGAIKGDRST